MGTMKGEKLNEPKSNPSQIYKKKLARAQPESTLLVWTHWDLTGLQTSTWMTSIESQVFMGPQDFTYGLAEFFASYYNFILHYAEDASCT